MLSILNFQITISLYPGSGTVFSQFIYIFLAVCWDRGELFFAISHFTTVRKHWKGALKLRDREIHAKLRKKNDIDTEKKTIKSSYYPENTT